LIWTPFPFLLWLWIPSWVARLFLQLDSFRILTQLFSWSRLRKSWRSCCLVHSCGISSPRRGNRVWCDKIVRRKIGMIRSCLFRILHRLSSLRDVWVRPGCLRLLSWLDTLTAGWRILKILPSGWLLGAVRFWPYAGLRSHRRASGCLNHYCVQQEYSTWCWLEKRWPFSVCWYTRFFRSNAELNRKLCFIKKCKPFLIEMTTIVSFTHQYQLKIWKFSRPICMVPKKAFFKYIWLNILKCV
jgi:hypothetical protein